MIELAVAAAEIESAKCSSISRWVALYFGFPRLPSLVTALGCGPARIGSVTTIKKSGCLAAGFSR
ncbi:hypothetical protein [Bradyrhizobium elkanii]|uniref:hypothetical protein n=1 Tax=Bradyrhizobium elkanii TaxID=29448 RepID=UPI0035192AF7